MRRTLVALVVSLSAFLASSVVAAPAWAGSLCEDGTYSSSEGPGTCSHHGGVAGPASAPASPVGPLPAVESGVRAPKSFTKTLKALPVRPESPGGYERSFFKHWIRQGDGCDTRQNVLIRQSLSGTRSGCIMVGGRWLSFYDKVTVYNPSELDIDHMVPLAQAWASGAGSWTESRRTQFANDLGYRDSLVAVTASTNRSKSDKDPAEWLPPSSSARCRYAQAWVSVKWRWNLAVDAAEKSALARELSACPKRLVPRPLRAG